MAAKNHADRQGSPVMPELAGTVEFYDRLGPELAQSYDRVTFEAVHGPMLHHFPPIPADVLDIGAGSGRDALALEKIGYTVTAVEPAATLRNLGQSRSATARWVDDRLPELASLRAEKGRFDFILCSAVLMSVEPDRLGLAFEIMALLLRQNGKLMISIRAPSLTDVPGILHNHSGGALGEAAANAGLRLIETQQLQDALGRAHNWRVFVYQRD